MATKGIKRKVQAVEEAPEHAETSSDDNDSGTEATPGNAAWADSIAKVLSTNKPKTKKSIVLSKAKKLAPRPKDSSDAITFEIDGEVKEEKPDKEELEAASKKLKNQALTLRVKPTAQDFERERALRKIATRGVVQLFNAVRLQQKDLQQKLKEAGPLDSKRDAVLNNIDKKKFLDVLMSGKRAQSEAIDNPVKHEDDSDEDDDDDEEEEDEEATGSKKKGWNVLRDDYMTNKKVKSWDEESDEGDMGDSTDEDDEE